MNGLRWRLCDPIRRPGPRGWSDAWLAELSAIEGRRERLSWLLDGVRLLLADRGRGLAAVLSPLALVCAFASVLFAWLSFIEYEGLALDDDVYPMVSAAFAAAFSFFIALTFKRRTEASRP